MHPELEDSLLYWHDQFVTSVQLELRIVRGLRPHLGVEVALPLRMVRSRIQFEDAARQPFTPPSPDTHHRNETLTHWGDPRVGLQWAHVWAPWTWTGSAGVSIPLGRTEENPFALGREGLTHQHIQFGTGTVDPYVGLSASRRLGRYALALDAFARFTLSENAKGYRAGDRLSASTSLARTRGPWSARAGFDVAHEAAERWGGVLETEGNLGRTDWYGSLGVARRVSRVGTLGLTVRTSLLSRAGGEQARLPFVLQVSATR